MQINYSRLIGAFFAAALIGAGTARAQEGPATGVPESSIAAGWGTDPVRAALAARGFNYGVNYTGEYYNVTAGGVSRGSSFNGLVDMYGDLDLERAFGWKGGVIHSNAYYIHGEGPTTKRIGNIFAVSNIEALETFRLDELWFEQSLLDDAVKVKLGAIAADTEFFTSDSAGQFVNGTFGWAGILAANMVQGGPAYPLTAMGVRVDFAPSDALRVRAALFNGSPANPAADDAQEDNKHGTDFRFGDSALAIIEGEWSYNLGLPGIIKLGGWRQFTDDEYLDFLTDAPVNGSHGLYAIVDQRIWKSGEDQSISVFGRISTSPERQNPIDFYFDAGIVFAGLVPGRSKDSFGAAFGYGHISDRLAAGQALLGQTITSSSESVLEINYTAEIMPGWTITPDFQYIWNPGGRLENPERPGEEIEDAVVIGARTKVNY